MQPTGASVDELRPAVREFHALVKEGIAKEKLAFALNRIGTAAEEGEARAYVAEAGYGALNGCLLERPAYRKAQNTGHAVTETSYAGLNAKADALIQSLIDKVEDHGRFDEAETASSLGAPPPLAEASPNLHAPETAPSPAAPSRRMAITPPPAALAGEALPRRDGRTARRSGRTLNSEPVSALNLTIDSARLPSATANCWSKCSRST